MTSLIPFSKTIPIILQKYDEGMSLRDLAQEYETNLAFIDRVLTRHGRTKRTKSEAQLLALKQGKCHNPTKNKKRTVKDRMKISKTMKSKKINKQLQQELTDRSKLNAKIEEAIERAERQG